MVIWPMKTNSTRVNGEWAQNYSPIVEKGVLEACFFFYFFLLVSEKKWRYTKKENNKLPIIWLTQVKDLGNFCLFSEKGF